MPAEIGKRPSSRVISIACCPLPSRRIQRRPLLVDLAGPAEAYPTQNRQRRTPSLDGVLEREGRDERRQDQPAPVGYCAKDDTGKGHRRGIRLKRPLDIPFGVQLAQSN